MALRSEGIRLISQPSVFASEERGSRKIAWLGPQITGLLASKAGISNMPQPLAPRE